ncbi:hypothetical protein NDU88_003467 [Pleurodeles waltl]|uniref:Uncharacterized protein n=1 Tax=Pleurodeles waltl TaxID=8319 RepID=A0AAV7SDJ0_PLEWA|nr:hypothetical protein NDU88_003467 [Pleurodeles waltl]
MKYGVDVKKKQDLTLTKMTLIVPIAHCDGSLRSDPHTSIACAVSATDDLVTTTDSDAVVGWLQQPRDRLRVKRGVSVMPREVASWSANIPELVTTEEQEEPGIEETAGRTTEQAGAEESRRRPEDRWPRGAYS